MNMTKVYKLAWNGENVSVVKFVTESGKVLEFKREYWSGMRGNTVFDPCVTVPPDWFSNNISCDDLYWISQEDFVASDNFPAMPKVEIVEYKLPFVDPPHEGQMGMTTILLPASLL
jgi:hypothetical protein